MAFAPRPLSKSIREIMSLRLLALIAVICITPGLSASPAPAGAKRAEVIVLSTLHQFHGENSFYTFKHLSEIIERLKPDVLALELTPDALTSRREQKVKQEYQKSVFPLLDKHRYRTVALEPAEPLYSELVESLRNSGRELRARAPEKDEAFGLYTSELYEYLFKTWDSPRAVNSARTDALFEIKHRFQNALYGPSEARAWEGWNKHFLSQILETARLFPGKRIVVLVGVEHGYWLRSALSKEASVRLLDTEKLLKREK